MPRIVHVLSFLLVSCLSLYEARPARAQAISVVVTAARANVRAGAGTSFRIIGSVEQGSEMRVVRSLRGWYEVSLAQTRLSASSGFISASLVRPVYGAPERSEPSPPVTYDPPSPPPSTYTPDPPPPPVDAPKSPPAAPLAAASAPGSARVIGYLGIAPWRMSTEGASVRLTSEADRSPLPSLVEYKDSSQKRGFTAGLVYRFPESMAGTSLGVQPEAGVEFTLGGSMGQVEFVGGGAALLSRGTMRLRVGARATAGYVWGKIGEVGSTPGDVYLIAPDDERYEVGSVITVSAVPIGIEPTLGAEMRVGRASVVVEGGYRLSFQLGDWDYSVEDGDDSSRRSTLPASGFRANPPTLGQSGLFLRVGFGF